MNFDTEFYIAGENLLRYSNADNKLYDGYKIHWTPDLGNLFVNFNKNTEYIFNFSQAISFDLIKIYLIPTANYSKFGTTMSYDNVNNTYWLPYVRIYYSTDGTNFVEITSSNAVSITNWFQYYNAGYQPYIGNNDYGWINNSCGFIALKLNSTISNVLKIKISFNRNTTFLNDYKVCEIELKQLKKFKIREFNLNSENEVINNSFNKSEIFLKIDDLDFTLFNFADASNEIFGKINKDGTDYFLSNLIINSFEIDSVSKNATLQLIPYWQVNLSKGIDYNSPILTSRKYYPNDVIDLLLLMANLPSYMRGNWYGLFTPCDYYPDKENNILTELEDFLEANRQIFMTVDYKSCPVFYSRGYETYQTVSKTSEQYIEIPANSAEDYTPFSFNYFFNDRNFFETFVSQDIIHDYRNIQVYNQKIKHNIKKKRKKYLLGLINEVKRREIITETINEIQEISTPSEKETIKLVEWGSFNSIPSSYYTARDRCLSTQKLTIRCLSVPNNQVDTSRFVDENFFSGDTNRMFCFCELYLPAFTQNFYTTIQSIDIKYKDVRGEINFNQPLNTNFKYALNYNYNANNYDMVYVIYLKLFYNSPNADLLVGLYLRDKATGRLSYISRQRFNQDVDPRYRNFFQNLITGYSSATCEFSINVLTGNNYIPSPEVIIKDGYYPNQNLNFIMVQKMKLSGIKRVLSSDTFPSNYANYISIREWKGCEFSNLQINYVNAEYNVLYKANKDFQELNENLPMINVDYPVQSQDIIFAYILKNVYPYYSGIKLWFIKSIDETINFNYSNPTNYIEKYSKNLNYAKAINDLGREFIVSRLNVIKNVFSKNEEIFTQDITLKSNDIFHHIEEKKEILLPESFICFLQIKDKTYFFNQGSGTINDGTNYFDWAFSIERYRFRFYLKNLNTFDMVAKLNIFYKKFSLIQEDNFIVYDDLVKKYGYIENEIVGKIFNFSQVWYCKKFFDFYNQTAMFTMRDIIFEGDLGIWFNNNLIKIVDNYLGKKILILPNKIEHNISEDLIFETSIQGKIIGVENI